MYTFKRFFILFLLALPGLACSDGEQDYYIEQSHSEILNGVSYVGSRNEVGIEAFTPLQTIHSQWVALIPFGFIGADSPQLFFDIEWQWWGEKTEGILQNTKDARTAGQKIMLKPQVWIRDGAFTGDLNMQTEAEWLILEDSYSAYILHFAAVAEDINAELFCIGTEFRNFVLKRPAFWTQLISDVRKVYTGNLTYAANWDSYQQVPFWDKMEFIGVDAYFPLSAGKTPEVNTLKTSWDPIKAELKKFSVKNNKNILFTEYGYASRDFSTEKPWDSWRGKPVNLQAQANAYQAIFETFWSEEWFSGGFLWKWYSYNESAGGLEHAGYTPQNKPAQEIIKSQYKLYAE